MNSPSPVTRLVAGLSVFLLGALSGCSGSSGSSETAAQGGFQLTTVSVEPGRSDWPINKAIEFRFNEDLDGSTVNRNTIQIREVGGGEVLGDFLFDPSTNPRLVVFQPNCPTKEDFSDAGFKPGRQYEIRVIGAASGSGITVMSASGRSLVTGRNQSFGTPDADQLDKVFDDSKPGQGPQPVVRGVAGVPTSQAIATRVEINGGDQNADNGGVTTYFELVDGSITELDVPLNLFSKSDSKIEVLLVVDQPVDPASENINAERVTLQFQDAGGVWRPIRSIVSLENNCAQEGATLRLAPVGILPPSSNLRVNISPEFRDLRGEFNLLPVNNFARMRTQVVNDPNFPNPNQTGDEFLEEFVTSTFEDQDAAFAEGRAIWDTSSGRLVATFGFGETEQDRALIDVFSDFDYRVPAGLTVQFSTATQQVSNSDASKTQIVEGGRLYCRNLTVEAGARLVISGPNPLKVFATGDVLIEGTLEANGFPANNVQSLNLATVPQSGGLGAASGGDGGIGSPLTTASSPRGGPGRGAFNIAGLGGQGGESGYAGTANRNTWRPGGGGGGVFGPNDPSGAVPSPIEPEKGLIAAPGFDGFDSLILLLTEECEFGPTEKPSQCAPDPNDPSTATWTGSIPTGSCCCKGGECPGFPGFTIDGAFGAESGLIPPRGGSIGPSPFVDSNTDNNYFGIRLVDGGNPVAGELNSLWAGAGGGGGGDAVHNEEFPSPVFQDPNNNNLTTRDFKGGGGGGGGGTIHILALGEIKIAGAGIIRANGGAGGTGESTFFIDRVGGGGGGGSGGHIVLESAVGLNLEEFDTSTGSAIVARGGFGGLGLPVGENPEGTPEFNEIQKHIGRRINDGGGGGPGVIQVHVPGATASDQLLNVTLPGGAASLADFSQPDGIVLVPSFGSRSRAQSDWIALGGASPAAGATDDPVQFLFGGTDPDDGLVISNASDEVVPIDAILSVSLSVVDAASSEVTVLAGGLTGSDDVYLRNTSLLNGFQVNLDDGGGTSASYTVTSAEYSSGAGTLTLTLSGSTSLAAFEAGDSFELVPRFFRVLTIDGSQQTLDELLNGQTVKIEFQGARIDEDGEPFLGVDGAEPEPILVDWTTNIENLNDDGSFPNPLAFFRFAVTMDIDADGSIGLSTETPVMGLEFLRMPFIFSGPTVP